MFKFFNIFKNSFNAAASPALFLPASKETLKENIHYFIQLVTDSHNYFLPKDIKTLNFDPAVTDFPLFTASENKTTVNKNNFPYFSKAPLLQIIILPPELKQIPKNIKKTASLSKKLTVYTSTNPELKAVKKLCTTSTALKNGRLNIR